MKERPILWSAPMVLALLAGRKTQTRRIVKHEHIDEADVFAFDTDRREWEMGEVHQGPTAHVGYVKPYAEVGDRLWGRETFSTDARGVYPCPRAWYRADFTKHDDPKNAEHIRECDGGKKPWADCFACATDGDGVTWRPSIFMPRALSRLLHEVTAVRVERLQEITEEDAIAEGLVNRPSCVLPDVPMWGWPGSDRYYRHAREAYLAGWDTINGKGSAASNPWVWVVSFKPVAA